MDPRVEATLIVKLFTTQQIAEEPSVRDMIKACDNAVLNAEMIGLLNDDPGIPTPYKTEPILPHHCLGWRAAEAAFLGAHFDLVEAVKGAR